MISGSRRKKAEKPKSGMLVPVDGLKIVSFLNNLIIALITKGEGKISKMPVI